MYNYINDFANSLKIPRNIMEAADNAVNGSVFSCDVGLNKRNLKQPVIKNNIFADHIPESSYRSFSGMMKRSSREPIGYIPTGTTNDFANSLKIPRNIMEAADNLQQICHMA